MSATTRRRYVAGCAAVLLLVGVVVIGLHSGTGSALGRLDLRVLLSEHLPDRGSATFHTVRIGVAVLSPVVDGVLLSLVALWVVRRSGRWEALATSSLALVVLTVVVLGLKAAYGRPGPSGEVVHGGAYPSGHTASAVACFVLLAAALLRPRWAAVIGGAVGGGIGIAMVVAQFHWVSDVLGGWLLGWAVVCVVLLLPQRWLDPYRRVT